MLTTFRKSRRIETLSGHVLTERVSVTVNDVTGRVTRVTTGTMWFDAPDPDMPLSDKLRNPERDYKVVGAADVTEDVGWTTRDDALRYLTENGYR